MFLMWEKTIFSNGITTPIFYCSQKAFDNIIMNMFWWQSEQSAVMW